MGALKHIGMAIVAALVPPRCRRRRRRRPHPTPAWSGRRATLGSGRWDARRDSIAAHETAYAAAGGSVPLVEVVRTTCPDALARTEAALDLVARMAVASQAPAEEDWADVPLCTDEIVTVGIRNPTTEPIGVMVATGEP